MNLWNSVKTVSTVPFWSFLFTWILSLAKVFLSPWGVTRKIEVYLWGRTAPLKNHRNIGPAVVLHCHDTHIHVTWVCSPQHPPLLSETARCSYRGLVACDGLRRQPRVDGSLLCVAGRAAFLHGSVPWADSPWAQKVSLFVRRGGRRQRAVKEARRASTASTKR